VVWCGGEVRAGWSERNELGGDGECGSEWGGECRPEGASEVRALVVVSAERGECGGGDGECGGSWWCG
jgi:hypothetical protein